MIGEPRLRHLSLIPWVVQLAVLVAHSTGRIEIPEHLSGSFVQRPEVSVLAALENYLLLCAADRLICQQCTPRAVPVPVIVSCALETPDHGPGSLVHCKNGRAPQTRTWPV